MVKSNMPVYRVKVSLKRSEPLIWRRLLVPSDAKLSQFHQMLQAAMGWTDSHLHRFGVGLVTFSYPHEPGDLEEMTAVDERQVKLCHLVPLHRPFVGEFRFDMEYVYDFGDSWEHEVVFEDVLRPDGKQKAPLCLEGENTCPPEDSGGVSRWNETIQSGGRTEAREWTEKERELIEDVGGEEELWEDMEEYDLPKAQPFDLKRINQRLRAIR